MRTVVHAFDKFIFGANFLLSPGPFKAEQLCEKREKGKRADYWFFKVRKVFLFLFF